MTTEKKSKGKQQGSPAQQGGAARGAAKGQRGAKAEATSTTGSAPAKSTEPSRVLTVYRGEIAPQLTKEFGYKSAMEIPRLDKIVVNIGIGAEAIQNTKAIESATGDLTTITGQKPVVTKARKSIAGFKVREGMPMGLKVTLRGRRFHVFATFEASRGRRLTGVGTIRSAFVSR